MHIASMPFMPHDRPKPFIHPETGGTFAQGGAETPNGTSSAARYTKYQGFWYRDKDFENGKPKPGSIPLYSRYTPTGTLARESLIAKLKRFIVRFNEFWDRWFTVHPPGPNVQRLGRRDDGRDECADEKNGGDR